MSVSSPINLKKRLQYIRLQERPFLTSVTSVLNRQPGSTQRQWKDNKSSGETMYTQRTCTKETSTAECSRLQEQLFEIQGDRLHTTSCTARWRLRDTQHLFLIKQVSGACPCLWEKESSWSIISLF